MYGLSPEKTKDNASNAENLLATRFVIGDAQYDSPTINGDEQRPLPPKSESSFSIGPASRLTIRRKKNVCPNDGSDDYFKAV